MCAHVRLVDEAKPSRLLFDAGVTRSLDQLEHCEAVIRGDR